jgi:WD40 repeat protein
VLIAFCHTGSDVTSRTQYARDYKYLDSIVFLPDRKVLAVTQNTRTINLVDTRTGTKLQQFSSANALAFLLNSKVLAVALDSRVICLFNAYLIILLCTLNRYCTNTIAIVFSPNSKV